MRDCGLGHPQRSRKIADTDIRLKKGKQDPDAGSVSEGLEQFRQVVEAVLGRHLFTNHLHLVRMDFFHFTTLDVVQHFSGHFSHILPFASHVLKTLFTEHFFFH